MATESDFCLNTGGETELLTVNNTGDNPDMSSWEKLYDGSTNKYLGYVASVEQAMKLVREYELKTTSKLSCFKAEKTFGQGDPFAKSRKVYFKDDNIPFDGSPFFIIATKVFDCRHGPDRKKASKKKLAQEKNEDHCHFKKRRFLPQNS